MTKTYIAACMLLGGIAVFILGSPYYSVFFTNRNQMYLVILSLVLLITAVLMYRSNTLHQYWTVSYALFIAAVATLFLNTGILNIPYDGPNELKEIALDKFGQFCHIVPILIIFTLIVKDNFASLFITKGDLKQGLRFGIISFVIFAALSYIIQVRDLDPSYRRVSSILYILIFVFSNSIMEELWFRAIFLKRYTHHIGRMGAVLITSLIFGASHINATYQFPGGGFVFGLVVFALGYAAADSMLKTNSLIGAVLFHAGYDLMIILPVINSM